MPRDPERWLVDDLSAQDRAAWARLHRGYLDFYEVADPDKVSRVIWGWLMDPGHELKAVVARSGPGGEPVGLAHYRPFSRPLAGSTACFLDDLFVAPEHRGSGAVDALLAELRHRSREHGWTSVRWITRESNATARSTYDRLAVQTDLVTYELRVD